MLYSALIISTTYGIGMEVVQYTFFPGRYFEFWDIVANISGAFAGVILFRKFIT